MTRTKKPDQNDRIAELEDDLKERDPRIAELKAELEEERDLTHRLSEHVKDCNDQTDEWIQAFDMVANEEGVWTWRASFAEGEDWADKWMELVKKPMRLLLPILRWRGVCIPAMSDGHGLPAKRSAQKS